MATTVKVKHVVAFAAIVIIAGLSIALYGERVRDERRKSAAKEMICEMIKPELLNKPCEKEPTD